MAKPLPETFEEEVEKIEGLTDDNRDLVIQESSFDQLTYILISEQDKMDLFCGALKEITNDTYKDCDLALDLGSNEQDNVIASKKHIEYLTSFLKISERAQQLERVSLELKIIEGEGVSADDIYSLIQAVFALKNINDLCLEFSSCEIDFSIENLEIKDGCLIKYLSLSGFKNIDKRFLDSLEMAKDLDTLSLCKSNLESLDFLSKIPGNLARLCLDNLGLKDYPKCLKDLSQLPSLEVISLTGNEIRGVVNIKVGDGGKDQKAVRSINLSNNPLERIVIEGGSRDIEELRLEKCKISDLTHLLKTEGLRNIYLAENCISSIPEDVFFEGHEGVFLAGRNVSVDLRENPIEKKKEKDSVGSKGRKRPAEGQVDGNNPPKRVRTEGDEMEVIEKVPERTPSPEPEDPENEPF